MNSTAPVALFVFNRPDLTARTFQQIARAKPPVLFVIADGPREGYEQDSRLINQTRAIVDIITWPCEVVRNYTDENLGCKRRISSGLNWVFDNVDRAIILEDDCCPSSSFFPFCTNLLDRYHDDPRVVAISGTKVHCPEVETEHSYFFSKYFQCWGWASWRRVWKNFDEDMQDWPQIYSSGFLRDFTDSYDEQCYWARMFDKQYRGQFDSWAYPMMYNCWQLGGLVALPHVNLVSNIGFDGRGTHTTNTNDPLANFPAQQLGAMRHPPKVDRLVSADQLTFRRSYAHDLVGTHKWKVRLRHIWHTMTGTAGL